MHSTALARSYAAAILAVALLGSAGVASATFPHAVAAQDYTGATSLTLTASPQYPRPGDTVTLTPASTLVNLANLTLTWTVDGKAAGSTTGGASFQVQAGANGSATDVSVSGGGDSASVAIVPADVEIVPEPDTTVHPLYDGSPLVGSDSTVRLVAMADLRTSAGRIDPTQLVYDWKLGDQQLTAQSGIGDDVLDVQAPEMYRNATISLTVTDQADQVIGQDSYELDPVAPSMLLYVNDPLEGPLYDNALGDGYAMPDTEASFVAVPYFFSSTPTVAWTIGGQPSTQGPFVTVRSSGTGSGSAALAASATNPSDTLETAGAETTVSFQGTPPSGGLFGL